jgi:HAE1 family hydrophobic/amphiphilic exporter-1
MFVGAGLILVILVWQFNSFAQPLMIMSAIPLSFVGVIYGLMICGFHFSISAMIGVVALAGIVVNDAIVLVDFINKLRAQGMSVEDAVIRAGQLRLRPIFLTTVTTIGGVLPMALNLAGGAEFFQPLTVSIIFGLAFATALTLIVVPTAYYTQVKWAENLGRRLQARRERKASLAG